jgi:hypothetical protein
MCECCGGQLYTDKGRRRCFPHLVICPPISYRESCITSDQSSLYKYQGADKSFARPTSRCILVDGENISFVASLVININSTNILQLWL